MAWHRETIVALIGTGAVAATAIVGQLIAADSVRDTTQQQLVSASEDRSEDLRRDAYAAYLAVALQMQLRLVDLGSAIEKGAAQEAQEILADEVDRQLELSDTLAVVHIIGTPEAIRLADDLAAQIVAGVSRISSATPETARGETDAVSSENDAAINAFVEQVHTEISPEVSE